VPWPLWVYRGPPEVYRGPSRGVPWPLYEDHALEVSYYLYSRLYSVCCVCWEVEFVFLSPASRSKYIRKSL